MHDSLQGFCRWFWICCSLTFFYGMLAFIILRRRNLWLRSLDAFEALFLRIGFSIGFARFGRGFYESRAFAVGMFILGGVFVLLAVVNAAMYFYFSDRLG